MPAVENNAPEVGAAVRHVHVPDSHGTLVGIVVGGWGYVTWDAGPQPNAFVRLDWLRAS